MQFSVGSISPILASFSWIFSLRVTPAGGVERGERVRAVFGLPWPHP